MHIVVFVHNNISTVFIFCRFFYPCALQAEGYCCQGPGGRPGGCHTCGTHIFVTAWQIFSVPSSVELSRPVVVHCHDHLPICPIWACPWAKNLSNLPQIGSRLCGMHISETVGWIYSILSFMDLPRPVAVQHHSYLPICPTLACLYAKYISNQWAGWGCEVSCGGHHRPRGKTTTGSALDGAVFDIAQILAYLVHNTSRSQFYLGFGHFGWLPSFFGQ